MKKTKASVDYRVGHGTRRCKNCTMWRSGMCSAVTGSIDPEFVCDIFARR